MQFEDRKAAGRALGARLSDLELKDPVVLALPRGGVPVGIEVARALQAPLDIVMVRKIGAPMQPELAIGAVVNGSDPQVVLNERIVPGLGVSQSDIDAITARELAEIARRREIYLRGRQPVPIRQRTAIVVDDGIATGATVRASLIAVRRRDPARLILAVPVAPADVLRKLKTEVDDILCLHIPDRFGAVGAYYRDFGQTSDAEVIRDLDEAKTWAPGTEPG